MAYDEIGRIRDDLEVMKRAMGLRPSFGKGVLAFGVSLAVAAVGIASVGMFVEDDRIQAALFAAVVSLVTVGFFLHARRTVDLGPEIAMQVMLSISIYAVVWVAGSGYTMAMTTGPALGMARTAGLYATSVGILLAFSWMLVRSAVRDRERHYCLGLALSTGLAGMLLPLLGGRHGYPITHCVMAVGYLAAVAIQWAQLREVAASHGAD